MAAGDLGLFGPGSVTWRVHEEPILVLGGLRALFLQALHPRAIAGVVQNSGYKADPWGRLVRTINYVATTIYGTTPEAEAAADRVRVVHARMWATDPVTGEQFRVDDPELLRWVHVTEVDSYATTARRAGVRLRPEQWDAYHAEQGRRARLVGLDPAAVPATTSQVLEYYRDIRPQLKMTRDAADTLVFLSLPPAPWHSRSRVGNGSGGSGSGSGGSGSGAAASDGHWRRRVLDLLRGPPFRLASLGVAVTAFSLLPPWARRLYGGFGLPTTDLGATLSARTLRLGLNALPHRVYEGPLYQAAMARAESATAAATA